ncbi:UDP-N-acetylglucosamine 2-epimerase (hydrolyzing), partial [bacterium]|nr:UDP-N-acetylglucosamine 2-epimerase (hydrolyzing) [bacterium]
MNKLKIAVLTGTRAEYGILRPILRKVDAHPKLELILIVTGMHLSDEFGYTVDRIKKDGFKIDAEIATLNVVDTGHGMARYIGKTIIELSDVLNDLNPDVLFLLGDRAEMLAGAIAAACANILIAHVHSGESSGSIDQSFRHAISKLSHLFFVATEDSRDNLLAIGEEQKRIFIVGAPGLDGILENLRSPENMAKQYNLDFSKPIIL